MDRIERICRILAPTLISDRDPTDPSYWQDVRSTGQWKTAENVAKILQVFRDFEGLTSAADEAALDQALANLEPFPQPPE